MKGLQCFFVILVILSSHCRKNHKPLAPSKPKGSDTVYVDWECEYIVNVSDPDRDSVQVQFVWGDGTISFWSDFVASGGEVVMQKVWDRSGEFYVKARARDRRGDFSSYSDSLKVKVLNVWNKIYQDFGKAYATLICPANKGGYVVGGHTTIRSFDSNFRNVILLFKIDERGNVKWRRTFSIGKDCKPWAICSSKIGGYVVVGTYTWGIQSGRNIFVLKIDEEGNLVWQRSLENHEFGRDVAICSDAEFGFLLVANIYLNETGERRILAIKLDSLGKIVWQKEFGEDRDVYAYDVCLTHDSCYLVVGYVNIPSVGNSLMYVFKFNQSGELIWEKSFGSGWENEATCITESDQYEYLIAGSTVPTEGKNARVVLLKIDGSGNVLWLKEYKAEASDAPQAICKARDGGYVVLVSSAIWEAGDVFAYVLKVDKDGNCLWEKSWSISGADVLLDIAPAEDGGFVMAGFNDFGIHLIKMSINGEAPELWKELLEDW